MYHLKLNKGLSYDGAVSASKGQPDVYTDDVEKYEAALKSGYFVDLTAANPTTGEEDGTEGDTNPEETSEEKAEDDKAGKPIWRMTVDELKAYAAENEIIIPEGATKEVIKAIITEAEEKAEEARKLLHGE